MKVFDYLFNIGGNFSATINGMSSAAGNFSAKIQSTQGAFDKLTAAFAKSNIAVEAMKNLSENFNQFAQSGITLNTQMHDLSAVAGVTGDSLKQIEGYARQSAKTFGTDASTAVEGYKLLLSQLTPEIAKSPIALQKMGDCIQVTSKLMGGDGTGAAEVLTTAMNQFGVSMSNPIAASKKMAEMMNVMAAAGQAGSAELPQIKNALEQCGMAAKSANVSFEETNAAIQVLDKAGKKGAEGGVALRNVLGILSQGRFLPADTQKALSAAGINIKELGDNSKSLEERLSLLKPVLNDAALFTKMFGTENANAARALVQGTDQMNYYTKAITGTNSAQQQAGIVMDSYEEKQKRIKQSIDDFKISMFQMSEGLSMWFGSVVELLVPLSQISPILMLVCKSMSAIKGLAWANMWTSVTRFVTIAKIQFAFMRRELILGQFASNGFMINIIRATLAVARFATVGLFQAIKGLGALILALITGGTTSLGFAATASAAFGAFKLAAVTACRAVSVAVMSIPIIGWIAATVAALAAIGIYFWNTSVKFRAVLKGIWSAFKTTFAGIGALAKNTFGAIGDLLSACFSLSPRGISAALAKLKSGFTNYGKQIGKSFSDAYNAEMASGNKSKKKGAAKSVKSQTTASPSLAVGNVNPTGSTLSHTGAKAAGGNEGSGSIRNINITIEKLVEKLEIRTTNLKESSERIQQVVEQALLSAVNDANLAV